MKSNPRELQKRLLEWRRSQELSMLATGKSMTEIAEELKVSVQTVSVDIQKLRKEAKEKNGEYIDNLPFEHKLSIASINKAHDELWALCEKETDSKQKTRILEVISDVVIKRQILLGDPQHIDRALRAVARIKRQLKDQEEEKEVSID